MAAPVLGFWAENGPITLQKISQKSVNHFITKLGTQVDNIFQHNVTLRNINLHTSQELYRHLY